MPPRHALIREIKPLLPTEALRAFEGLSDIAFLDSGSMCSDLARWSIVAADPFARFDIKDGIAFWQGQKIEGDPLEIRSEEHTSELQSH